MNWLSAWSRGKNYEAYITTAGRTFDLKVLAVVLVESLQTTISTSLIEEVIK
jgi:hypothetical protein